MKKQAANILKLLLGDYFYDLVYWYLFFRKNRKLKSGFPNILVINHFFDQDLEALELANNCFSFIIIHARILRYVATSIFPAGVDSYAVYNNPNLQKTKQRYSKILIRFTKRLIKKYGIKAVISPSDNFFYVREFIPILNKYKIPFFVVDKEGTISPIYFTHFASYLKENSPAIANHLLVWSERQKSFWEKTGFNGQNITVAGQPRSDFWRQPQRWKTKLNLCIPGLRSNNKMFLFFTYDVWCYNPEYIKKELDLIIEDDGSYWEGLREETNKVIYDFAKRHPEIDVVIKAHPQQTDIEKISTQIAQTGLPNVILTTGADLSNHLIVNADCIIGFQTTALIESMLTEKPIIYTFWGEDILRMADDLIPFNENNGVLVAHSPQELNHFLEETLSAAPLLTDEEKQARLVFTSEYFYNVDGRAAKRNLQVIKNLLKTND